MSSHNLQKHCGWPAAPEESHGCSPAEAERLLLLFLHLSATSRTLRKRLAEVAARVDLTEHELLAIWLCLAAGRVQSELAATLGISPAQMSGLVERLRARGLVELHRLAQDRRRHVWRTSAHGREVLTGAVPYLLALAQDLLRPLSAEEQQALVLMCQRLAGSCGHIPAPAWEAVPAPVVAPCPPPHAA